MVQADMCVCVYEWGRERALPLPCSSTYQQASFIMQTGDLWAGGEG